MGHQPIHTVATHCMDTIRNVEFKICSILKVVCPFKTFCNPHNIPLPTTCLKNRKYIILIVKLFESTPPLTLSNTNSSELSYFFFLHKTFLEIYIFTLPSRP